MIEPGESVDFELYFGAAPDEVSARVSLAFAGAQYWALAESSAASGPDRNHTVFLFGISSLHWPT